MTTTINEKKVRAVGHMSVADRVARGKVARAEVPRSSHATYEPPRRRRDPLTLLEQQAKSRVPELVPIRYGRMLVSPFTFYRGAAKIMAEDLAGTPRSGLLAQCCGDAHLSNFGLFASPERRLVFDLNDFDETLPGPWEWDVKRLAVSMLIAARDNGFGAKDQERAVLQTVGAYRRWIREFAARGNLDVWYVRLEAEQIMAEIARRGRRRQAKVSANIVAKAHTRDSMSAFEKLTEEVNGQRQIVDQSPLIVPLAALVPADRYEESFEARGELFHAYRATLDLPRRVLLEGYELADFARKVVGVGSVGTRAWIALLYGRDASDPLILQMKEAEASVLERPLGPSNEENHGERVVVGQRLMQASSDIFLSWLRVRSPLDGRRRDFYVRQLRDWKGSIETERLSPPGLAFYGELCGGTLARAHARSTDRIALAAYLGKGDTFDRALLAFSIAYAEQNERDYNRLSAAVKEGKVKAETGL
jgi:uncharacterized protein (DUF2252 family)